MEVVLKKIADGVIVPDDAEYIACVEDILRNEAFLSMEQYIQHGTTSCLAHCIAVSYNSYKACQKYGLDSRSAARAGLLHDLFLYDWHKHSPGNGFKMHGFYHPQIALRNAEKEFSLNEVEREIITKHMWPLTVIPPRAKEAYVVLYHDKICSLRETFGKPSLIME